MSDMIHITPLVSRFPWRALVAALLVLAALFGLGIWLGFQLQGVAAVSSLSALAVFAALVTWGTQSRR